MNTNNDLLAQINSAMKALTVPELGASILTPEKAQRFIRVVSESTRILNASRRITMNSHTHDIDRIGFASRILQGATEDTEPEGESKPDLYTNTLESKELIGLAGITDSTLEDNIEKEGFENTLLDLIANRVGIDLEELFLKGDRTSSDTFLAKTDGWLKKSANLVDGGATTPDFDPADPEDMFDAMLKAVPKKYLRDRSSWRFYVHWDIEDAYRDILRQRGTGLGDTAQTTATELAYKGIAVQDAANMPEGTALLVPPTNLVYGIYRDIRIEPDRIPKKRRTDFIPTLRVDCHYEDENASVVGQGYTG